LDPTTISGRFEEVTTQKEPGSPVFPEQSFITWRSPLRAEAADTG
jgi:hypothetical protein